MGEGMEKYGVDTGATEETMKKSASGEPLCPDCGTPTEKYGSVWLCPKCGTRPFEVKDVSKKGSR